MQGQLPGMNYLPSFEPDRVGWHNVQLTCKRVVCWSFVPFKPLCTLLEEVDKKRFYLGPVKSHWERSTYNLQVCMYQEEPNRSTIGWIRKDGCFYNPQFSLCLLLTLLAHVQSRVNQSPLSICQSVWKRFPPPVRRLHCQRGHFMHACPTESGPWGANAVGEELPQMWHMLNPTKMYTVRKRTQSLKG